MENSSKRYFEFIIGNCKAKIIFGLTQEYFTIEQFDFFSQNKAAEKN